MLVDGAAFQTLEGSSVTVTVVNGSTYINAAKALGTDFLVSSGVVHMIGEKLNYTDSAERPMRLCYNLCQRQ